MNAEEIRQKAIECGENFRTMCISNTTIGRNFNAICAYNCEYTGVECCSVVYGYEYGFADGVEEGKQIALADLAEHDKEIRADERKKFAFWLINRIHRNSLQRVLSETKNFDIMGIDNILSIYEKEQKNGE